MIATATLSSVRARWLGQDDVRVVLTLLNGPGSRTFVTGGAVRDSLARELPAPHDIDLVSSHAPRDARRLLDSCGFATHRHPSFPDILLYHPEGLVGIGIHGSVRCLGTGEPEAFARDAGTRDFTVNALLCDAEGRIEDHVGGLADARGRTLRFVSEEAAVADPVRLLRYFRMRPALGEKTPHGPSLAIVRRHARSAGAAPGDRLLRELALLVETNEDADVVAALRLMRDTGVLDAILPEADLGRFEAYVAGHEAVGGLRGRQVFRTLAALGTDRSPLLRWGDERDEMVAMNARALETAGNDLSAMNVARCFSEVARSWRPADPRKPSEAPSARGPGREGKSHG